MSSFISLYDQMDDSELIQQSAGLYQPSQKTIKPVDEFHNNFEESNNKNDGKFKFFNRLDNLLIAASQGKPTGTVTSYVHPRCARHVIETARPLYLQYGVQYTCKRRRCSRDAAHVSRKMMLYLRSTLSTMQCIL